ncbi:MAG: hypothetical protein ACYSUV_12675 [Planctomycetota bacterium]|jgi:hypothetical protein
MDDRQVTVAMFADVLPAELAKAQLQAEGIAAVVDQSAEHQLWDNYRPRALPLWWIRARNISFGGTRWAW